MNRALLAIALCLLAQAPLTAMQMTDGDITLRPEPPATPKIHGLTFCGEAHEALAAMAEQGLRPASQEALDDARRVVSYTFNGVPKDLSVPEGESHTLFFDGKLVRLDVVIPPTYSNFLLVRARLFNSAKERFTVAAQQEVMEDFLRTHLAMLEANQYGRDTEAHIAKSIAQGKTFFYYGLGDKLNAVQASLSFTAPKTTKEPRLILHYSDKVGMEGYHAYRKQAR